MLREPPPYSWALPTAGVVNAEQSGGVEGTGGNARATATKVWFYLGNLGLLLIKCFYIYILFIIPKK